MLVFGITLTAIGFALDPAGEIHDSVLWVLGQCLIYTGSIFGVVAYTRGVVDKRIGEWRDEVHRAKEEQQESNDDDTQEGQ